MAFLFFWASTNKIQEIWSIPSYSNEVDWASIDYTALYRPGWTPLFLCNPAKHELGSFVWFTVICRVLMFIASSVIFWIDLDGKWYHNPEQVVYILITCYVVPTTIVRMLRLNRAIDLKLAKEIPWPLKFSWFCYDIALPASFGCLIMYCVNVVVNKRNPMTIGLYVCNFLQMVGLDAVFGRMILIPNRFLMFMVVWIGWGVCFAVHFHANKQEFVFGVSIGVISFLTMSWFTYARMNLFYDNKKVIESKIGILVSPQENKVDANEEEDEDGGKLVIAPLETV